MSEHAHTHTHTPRQTLYTSTLGPVQAGPGRAERRKYSRARDATDERNIVDERSRVNIIRGSCFELACGVEWKGTQGYGHDVRIAWLFSDRFDLLGNCVQ